jgi:hypothetical protein
LRNVHLVVTDLEATRASLLEREAKVSAIRHKTPTGAWDGTFSSGLDPAGRDYASFANFSDPDGNSWVAQERGYRNVAAMWTSGCNQWDGEVPICHKCAPVHKLLIEIRATLQEMRSNVSWTIRVACNS